MIDDLHRYNLDVVQMTLKVRVGKRLSVVVKAISTGRIIAKKIVKKWRWPYRRRARTILVPCALRRPGVGGHDPLPSDRAPPSTPRQARTAGRRARCPAAPDAIAPIVSLAEPGSEEQVLAYGALAIALMALAYVGVPAVAAVAVVRASAGRRAQGRA